MANIYLFHIMICKLNQILHFITSSVICSWFKGSALTKEINIIWTLAVLTSALVLNSKDNQFYRIIIYHHNEDFSKLRLVYVTGDSEKKYSKCLILFGNVDTRII